MLYHTSSKGGIKVLQPHISSHKKPYIYALNNMVTSLIFGANHSDFDFIIDEENGIPVIFECYPKAFEEIFKGKSCYIYEVHEKGFKNNITGWEPEFVSENPVKTEKEAYISDLYAKLIEEENRGNLKINFYEDTKEYKQIIKEHIEDRLIRFNMLSTAKENPKLMKYFSDIIINLTETENLSN